MSSPTAPLVPQIEIALEEGDLDTAEKLLAAGVRQFGETLEFERLGRRLGEVRRLAKQPTIDALVQKSQERIRAADYPGALEPLLQAAKMAPESEALGALIAQTEKAAARHATAVERQSALSSAVREIEGLLARAALDEARQRLEEARTEHGRKKIFDELESKMTDALQTRRLAQAEEHLKRARQLRADGDWHGMLHQADQAIALGADSTEAEQLHGEAALRIEQLEGQRRLHETVEAGARDVERLIEAGELKRAEARLAVAKDQLGNHRLFEGLADRIDRAKKSLDVKRRGEWADRRAKEADALVQEAARLALGAHFEEALVKLAAARQLAPDHPDLDERERDYTAARDRRRAEEARRRAEEAADRRVAVALDALHLHEAAELLGEALGRFGESDRRRSLRSRLDGLREAEREADELPTPERLQRYGLAVRREIRQRERVTARAYSWKQALLYPLRGRPTTVLCVGISALLGAAGLALPALPWLMIPLALLLAPAILSHTLEGKNQPPSPAALVALGHLRLSATLGLFLGIVGLPVWGLLIWGPRIWPNSILWPVVGLNLFFLSVLGVPAAGAGGAFGRPWRLDKHLRVMVGNAETGSIPWLVADLLFGVVLAVPLLRVTLGYWAPALGIPLIALLEGYALVLIPHLVGVMVRSRRLDWAEAYA